MGVEGVDHARLNRAASAEGRERGPSG
jgi:hypothetical protein